MINITLYTKENCGLCDEVKVELDSLQAAYPHQLTEVDITQDTAVFETYKHIIPVVQIGNTALQAPISKQDLVSTLQATAINK